MTGHDDFDRALAGWFEADALAPAPAAGLDRVLDITRRRRPRPAWLAGLGSHSVGEAQHAGPGSGIRSFPRFDRRWSTALVLILVIAALVGGAILVGALLLRPSPLPAGHLGHLAYELDGDIYVADWDGMNPVRIADGAPADGGPGCQEYWSNGWLWSPDGRFLDYRSMCRGTVIISDPAGKTVAEFPASGSLVSWSPDSTRVATWLDESHTLIGIFGLDGVRQALLTLPYGYRASGDYDPRWSSDGMSVLIRLVDTSAAVVWELPIDGGSPRRMRDADPRSHFDAAYSRDGARVAFVPTLDSFSLVIAEADGSELRFMVGARHDPTLGAGEGDIFENPTWSPTGDRVAFIWSHVSQGSFWDQAGYELPRTRELRVVDVATGAVTTLASARGNYSFDSVMFSPEGDRILFSKDDANDSGDDANDPASLWSVRTDGSNAQLLVAGTGSGDWQSLPAGP